MKCPSINCLLLVCPNAQTESGGSPPAVNPFSCAPSCSGAQTKDFLTKGVKKKLAELVKWIW